MATETTAHHSGVHSPVWRRHWVRHDPGRSVSPRPRAAGAGHSPAWAGRERSGTLLPQA